MTSAPLSIGVLGAAYIAHQFCNGNRKNKDLRIAAVASRALPKAKAFAKEYGIAKAYGSYEALLQDPSIDAIYIPLPNHLHAEWAIKAAEHGKHVLCEKPLALHVDEAKAMFAAAEKNGVILLEGYPYWFQPHMRELLALAHGGAIGKVQGLEARFSFSLMNPGNNIRVQPEAGGGAMWDLGCYVVSLSRLLMGQMPERVMATPVWSGSDATQSVDMSILMSLEFSGGRSAHLSCAMNKSYERNATVFGSHGMIETSFPNHSSRKDPGLLRLWRGAVNMVPAEDVAVATGDGFLFEAQAFTDLVRRKDFAAMAQAKAASLDIARTLDAINASARTGKAVLL
jgi:predicted dehydrogenase